MMSKRNNTPEQSTSSPPQSPQQVLGAASRLHSDGQFAEAEAVYRQVLEADPDHPDALHLLGLIAHQTGNDAAAEELISKALAIRPDFAEAHSNLGAVFKAQKRLKEAAASYEKAIALKPDYADAHFNLANTAKALGQLDAAVAGYEKYLVLSPDNVEVHCILGDIHMEQGQMPDAIAAYEMAILIKPDLALVHRNLGSALNQQGRFDEALSSYQKALAIDPDFAEALSNLGNTFLELGRIDDAVASFERALALKPKLPEVHNNLGNAMRRLGRLEDATACFEKALGLNPGYAEAHSNLGIVFIRLARYPAAVASFKKALALKPDFVGAHSNLLFALTYLPGITGEAILEEALRWGEQHSFHDEIPEHLNTPDPERRLRVGYVSADFRAHAALYFLEPLLANHDHGVVEIFCYAEVRRPDDVTERFRGLADHWRSTVGLRDAELADMIRADGIDILVDCTGHTGNNRLPALTRKPAPVQVNYYSIHGGTSGAPAMDYVLSDSILSPPGLADHFSEDVVVLPQGTVAFCPDPDWPAVAPPRDVGDGPVFVCVNDPARIGDETISLWAALLNRVDGSRLLFKHATFGDPKTCAVWRDAFKALDGRADFEGLPGGWKENMDVYGRIDVVLDSMPMTGGLSCLIPLWMGVPVVTRGGDFHAHRFGPAMVTYSGLPELAASSLDDYLDIAAGLAQDRERLASLRHTLRDTMKASPICDAGGFAADIEAAYRTMWRTWCDGARRP